MAGIFKAYDIRGIYNTEIDEKIMKKIGKAFADLISGKNISVGYDIRDSSVSLFKAFTEGVMEQGKNVIDFGLTSTPRAYFASNYLKTDGTAMITASHNPKEYNGAKFTRKEAIPISGETGITLMEEKVLAGEFKEISTKGEMIQKEVSTAYKEHLKTFIQNISPMKVVVDCANGMGAQDFTTIQNELPLEVIPLYFELDGTFPNHEADPLKEENTRELKKRVISEKADLGIAFDGDGDRVFFIDETGEMVKSDLITTIIAKELLEQQPNSTILYDLRSSWIIKEEISKLGGKANMCRVGHSFIKAMMREQDAIFAGELSGHFYYKNNFFTDSGIVTVIQMLNILSKKGKTLSEIIKPMKKYSQSGEISSKVDDANKKMKELEKKYSDGKITFIDGIRIDYDGWWFNVRKSNTEPLLRLNIEAKTFIQMEEKRDELLRFIRS